MRYFTCHCCDNRLFIDNTLCQSCHSELGWCSACQTISALTPLGDGRYRCSGPDCASLLAKCQNYAVENVCNRMIPVHSVEAGIVLCDCCRHNRQIPDLEVDGHRHRWAKLESAKRRMFYTLDLLGLPHEVDPQKASPPLTFAFLADEVPSDDGEWQSHHALDPVYTGHADGLITINVKEADDVERERLRRDFKEAQRTLIGHFRHEVAHYYWDLLIKGHDEEAACIAVFGDHNSPSYAEALERYYAVGAPADWAERHVSAYATMHPWEDFAETFAFYLDMVAVLDTAGNFGITPTGYEEDLHAMLTTFQRLGMALNEVNREMGLVDIVPEIITPALYAKLEYVHELILRQLLQSTAN
ncbi:zinc-binding metallopeptidase family protein [Halomonas cupida]|uniref:zinc-binding metallopeptidase family protein n=1 Tax=Halomonas cupida TaxID=44933 RepID=UPI003A902018